MGSLINVKEIRTEERENYENKENENKTVVDARKRRKKVWGGDCGTLCE